MRDDDGVQHGNFLRTLFEDMLCGFGDEAFHASAVFFGDFFVLPGEQLLQQLGML